MALRFWFLLIAFLAGQVSSAGILLSKELGYNYSGDQYCQEYLNILAHKESHSGFVLRTNSAIPIVFDYSMNKIRLSICPSESRLNECSVVKTWGEDEFVAALFDQTGFAVPENPIVKDISSMADFAKLLKYLDQEVEAKSKAKIEAKAKAEKIMSLPEIKDLGKDDLQRIREAVSTAFLPASNWQLEASLAMKTRVSQIASTFEKKLAQIKAQGVTPAALPTLGFQKLSGSLQPHCEGISNIGYDDIASFRPLRLMYLGTEPSYAYRRDSMQSYAVPLIRKESERSKTVTSIGQWKLISWDLSQLKNRVDPFQLIYTSSYDNGKCSDRVVRESEHFNISADPSLKNCETVFGRGWRWAKISELESAYSEIQKTPLIDYLNKRYVISSDFSNKYAFLTFGGQCSRVAFYFDKTKAKGQHLLTISMPNNSYSLHAVQDQYYRAREVLGKGADDHFEETRSFQGLVPLCFCPKGAACK